MNETQIKIMNKIILKENDIKKIVSETFSLILLHEVYRKLKTKRVNENSYAEALNGADFNEIGKLRNNLFNIAVSITKNPDEAEDLTQNTILRAYEKSDLFKDGTNLMGWLRTIMVNLFKRSKTNSHAKKMSYIDDYTPYERKNSNEMETDNIDADDDESAFQENSYEEIKDELAQLIDELAAKKGEIYKQVFNLRMQGKEIQEIAQEVNLGYDRTSYILRFARNFLRKHGFEKNLQGITNLN